MTVDPKLAETQAESAAPPPHASDDASSPAPTPTSEMAAPAEPPRAEAATGADVQDVPITVRALENAAANAPAAAPYSPYTSGPLPTVQWDPTYGSRTHPHAAEQTGPLDEGGVPGEAHTEPPAGGTIGAPTAAYGYPPEHISSTAPVPADAYPPVDYNAYTNVPYATPPSNGMAGPTGMMPPHEYMAAPMPVMRDEVLEGRVTALEWQAYELASRTRDAEIDLLMHKVGSLEEMIMRFLSEVPIRLGGEIGVLERRLTYLSEELPARLQADASTSAEHVERLGQRVAALERYVQTMPSTHWRTEQEVRYETVERRIVELERFCAALARKGTAPREVVANQTEDAAGMNAMPGPAQSTPTRANGPGRGIQAREVDRRRPR